MQVQKNCKRVVENNRKKAHVCSPRETPARASDQCFHHGETCATIGSTYLRGERWKVRKLSYCLRDGIVTREKRDGSQGKAPRTLEATSSGMTLIAREYDVYVSNTKTQLFLPPFSFHAIHLFQISLIGTFSCFNHTRF